MSDAASAHPAFKPCGFTKGDLIDLNAKHFQQPLWSSYFFTNNNNPTKHLKRVDLASDDMPRCIKCGKTIDEHLPDSPPIPLPTVQEAYRFVNPWSGHQSVTVSTEFSLLRALQEIDGTPARCTVLKQLFPRCHYEACTLVGAHIIPRRAIVCFQALQAGPLAGWAEGDLNSAKNGIVMAKFIEDQFDNLFWCFVPGKTRGKWMIRVFASDLSTAVPIYNRGRVAGKFVKACSLAKNAQGEVIPCSVTDSTPLTFADLDGKELDLPEVVSVSAIMYHAEKTFERHNRSAEFRSLIPQFVAASKRKGSPPNIAAWLCDVSTKVDERKCDDEDASFPPVTAPPVNGQHSAKAGDTAPNKLVGGELLKEQKRRRRRR